MASTSFAKTRTFKGVVALLWLLAGVIVVMQSAMQYTSFGGATSKYLRASGRGTPSRTGTKALTTSQQMPQVQQQLQPQQQQQNAIGDYTPTLLFIGIGGFLAMSVVVGPMAALTVALSLLCIMGGMVGLGALLVGLATAGVVATGGSDVIRQRLEASDRGRWAASYFGRAAAARANGQ